MNTLMKTATAALAAIAALVLSVAPAQAYNTNDNKVRGIEVRRALTTGMTRAQVTQVLGTSGKLVAVSGGTYMFYYPRYVRPLGADLLFRHSGSHLVLTSKFLVDKDGTAHQV